MSSQSHRLPTGGRIDRETILTFTVDGVEYTGHPGDTVASALLANGQVRVGDSIYRRRPRGIVAVDERRRGNEFRECQMRRVLERARGERQRLAAELSGGGQLPSRDRDTGAYRGEQAGGIEVGTVEG